MADTHGFEVVLEAGEAVLQKALRGAWKSAKCPVDPGDTGRIPEYYDIPPGTALGSYIVADGQVQIPESELDAHMAPAVNGAEIKLGLYLQVQIQNPPLPSAGFFEMTADVRAQVPIGTLPGSKDVGMLLEGLPRGNVSVTLTSGDPLAPKLDQLLEELIHKAYEDGVIPHNVTRTDQGFGSITADVDVQMYDDDMDPARRIEVDRPTPATVRISIPIYMRMYNIEAPLVTLAEPMGILTRLIITAPFVSAPGSYTADLANATVTVQQPLTAAPGIEGSNYNSNKALPFIGGLIDPAIVTGLETEGETLAQGMCSSTPCTFAVPTVAQIETAIGDLFHADLEGRDYIGLWTPEAAGDVLPVNDVSVKALADALVIALNAGGGADLNAMTNFIPGGREFAIALSAARVQAIIDKSRDDNNLADSDLPRRFNEDGKDVDMTELDVFLTNGAIRMEGEVTVIDAILGSIDVDADFWVNVGMHWEPNANLNAEGGQLMKHDILGKDVDPEESVAFWIITIILAIISFGAAGLIGLLIVVIVAVIVEAIASSIGSDMLVDPVSNTLAGITAWPPNLARIGRVRAVFHDPIDISTQGLLMAGTLDVISSCATTAVMAANSGSAYSVAAAAPLNLLAGATHAAASYQWLPGDGAAVAAVQNRTHTYAASGLYVAKHSLAINQPGGATSRHFALVTVNNVAPTVDAGADITVNEGEVVTLVGHFEDVEYPDKHESTWNFGDSQPIAAGTIAETNNPPKAVGTSTVQHAWCDNGGYIVTLTVRDQNGGVGTDTRRVTVLNVPPTVDAGPDLYAYPCTVLTLVGRFKDPGWCDTHNATWELGDCTPPQTALVEETNEPPEGTGTATVSHVYERCGDYHARLTVVDDDGGEGSDSLVVRVVTVINADFEGGYHRRLAGLVANDWQPYAASSVPTAGTATTSGGVAPLRDVFDCETCVVHGGQRSQGIAMPLPGRAGIYQQIGANPGWDYQVTAWYSLAEDASGTARLGLDPLGGTDAAAASVVWASGSERRAWAQLANRVTARGKALTIFLELAAGDQGAALGWFDDVALVPIQPFCPEEPPAPEEPPEEPKRQCVDFADRKPDTTLPPTFTKEGFGFTSLDQQPRLIVGYGPPPNVAKLQLGVGVLVDLPFGANGAIVRLFPADRKPVELLALDADGNVVDSAQTPPASPDLATVVLSGAAITRLQITSPSREATLHEICISRVPSRPPAGGGMTEAKTLDEVRAVLDRHRDTILAQYGAEGIGIGRPAGQKTGYALVVYLASAPGKRPATTEIEGVPLRFEVTGKFRPLMPGTAR